MSKTESGSAATANSRRDSEASRSRASDDGSLFGDFAFDEDHQLIETPADFDEDNILQESHLPAASESPLRVISVASNESGEYANPSSPDHGQLSDIFSRRPSTETPSRSSSPDIKRSVSCYDGESEELDNLLVTGSAEDLAQAATPKSGASPTASPLASPASLTRE